MLCILGFPVPTYAADAVMEISPPVGTYRVYDDVTVKILLSSDGQLTRDAGTRITYDPTALTVTHVIKEGSVITSWFQDPYVDAELGEITFDGWFATPTVLSKDLALTLRIRPERTGVAELRFESGKIGASNSTAGNILTGFSSAKFRIEPEELNIAEVQSGTTGGTPSLGEVLGVTTLAPTLFVSSESHPDQNGWYATSTATFAFQFPGRTDVMWLGFDRREFGEASVRYAPPVYEKIIKNLEDGVWYMHASIEGLGGREEVHYRLQVDRKKPTEVTIEEVPPKDMADPNRVFLVRAKDSLSGISTYAFSVDDGPWEVWRDDGTGRYQFRANSQGVHQIAVRAHDKANNFAEAEAEFEVGFLESPLLTLLNSDPKEGDELRLSIMTTPNSEVSVIVVHADGQPVTERTKSDSKGIANFESKGSLKLGNYRVWGSVHDERGAVSTQSLEIKFTAAPAFFGVLSRHPNVPIAILVVLLLIFFLRRVLHGLREELNQTPTLIVDPLHGLNKFAQDATQIPQISELDKVVLKKLE